VRSQQLLLIIDGYKKAMARNSTLFEASARLLAVPVVDQNILFLFLASSARDELAESVASAHENVLIFSSLPAALFARWRRN
jgi:hypothetical protein